MNPLWKWFLKLFKQLEDDSKEKHVIELPPTTDVIYWEKWDHPLEKLPSSRRELYQIFGNPGTGNVDKKWLKENILEFHGKKQIPGIPKWKYFKCHRLAVPFVREGFRRAGIVCPQWEPEKIHGFIFRHQRHDSSRPLSDHSFGAAFDVDPHKNRAKYFKKGEAPKLWSEEWYKHWPNGISKEVVEAFQSVGWTWAGDWDSDKDSTDHVFLDPQHFQLRNYEK